MVAAVHSYFETGLSSVYLWDLDLAGAFAGVVLLKSDLAAGDVAGAWDSIHIFETSGSSKKPSYKLTSTVMLRLGQTEKLGETEGVQLAGSLTRQVRVERHWRRRRERDTHGSTLGNRQRRRRLVQSPERTSPISGA
jgi:hypothetical protein